jgi:hypothetical protein
MAKTASLKHCTLDRKLISQSGLFDVQLSMPSVNFGHLATLVANQENLGPRTRPNIAGNKCIHAFQTMGQPKTDQKL